MLGSQFGPTHSLILTFIKKTSDQNVCLHRLDFVYH